MKTKILNTLFWIRKSLIYTLIFGIIFEILFLSIPIHKLVTLPGFLNIYNYVLAAISTFLVFGIVFLPKDKKESSGLNNKKDILKKDEDSGSWIFHFRGLDFPVRFLVFAIIGFLAGVYFLSSFIIFNVSDDLNFIILLILLFFGIVYPLTYFFFIFSYVYVGKSFFILVQKILGVNTDYQINEFEELHKGVKTGTSLAFDDVLMYYVGGFAGLCFVGLIAALVAIGFGIFLLVKGIIWLIHNPNPWGIFAAIALPSILIVYLWTKKELKELRKIHDSL